MTYLGAILPCTKGTRTRKVAYNLGLKRTIRIYRQE